MLKPPTAAAAANMSGAAQVRAADMAAPLDMPMVNCRLRWMQSRRATSATTLRMKVMSAPPRACRYQRVRPASGVATIQPREAASARARLSRACSPALDPAPCRSMTSGTRTSPV